LSLLSVGEGLPLDLTLESLKECFLDGHEKAFEAFGGIPGEIRYDTICR
jgi:transposase